ncbi:hypothetical protein TWF225_009101 [Orbilia oligospora]|nr:hypothetical protein TWF225_009101 [Orbilia oligospora]KAF3241148.1 hypothetical protein TWF128_011121 [Orbilia oligospora]KAF3253215.1 hypothetical protein TWF217_007481 [Orbilia oligospora]
MQQFFSLPTEICDSILWFLEDDELSNFAKLSKSCYLITFPLRFRGVVIRVYDHEDKSVVSMIGSFDEGRWLASVRHCVRSITFDIEDFSDMIISFPSIFRFSNTTGLVIKIKRSGSIERRLYVAIFRLLRTLLPMYENLTSISLDWEGFIAFHDYPDLSLNCRPSDLDIRGIYDIRETNLDLDDVDGDLKIVETAGRTGDDCNNGDDNDNSNDNYNYGRSQFTPDIQKLLGPSISDEEFKDLVTTKIQFPKKLRSFAFSTRALTRDACEPLFLLPLGRCKELTTLSIENVIEETQLRNEGTKFEEGGGGGEGVSKNRQSKPIYSFPNIKALHLTNVTKFNHIPSTVPVQFPNLESFKLTNSKHITKSICIEYNASWPEVLPEIPTLRFAEIPSPSGVIMGPYGNSWVLEKGLSRRTSEGRLLGLKTVNIIHEYGQRIEFVGTRTVVSVCRFRRKSNHEVLDSGRAWVQIDE